MIITTLLLVLVLAQSLAMVSLGATAAVARLSGDRRAAVEAGAALESALAESRVDHALTLANLAEGTVQPLPVSGPAGWQTTATAWREPGSRFVRLVVVVRLYRSDGVAIAGRRGTLLLEQVAADTAIVIGSRPRF